MQNIWLDTSSGIEMLLDELTRIEYGVTAGRVYKTTVSLQVPSVIIPGGEGRGEGRTGSFLKSYK